MSNALVSILTPCHNSEAFFFRLLDSVLMQSYPYVEMIVVDNDSKDKTPEIVKGYIPRFEERGYTLKYIHQEDAGPSAAINNGLKRIKGEYLIMPDSDDYFADKDTITIMVEKFFNLPDEYAVVRCQQQIIYERDMSKGPIEGLRMPEYDDGTNFRSCLLGEGYVYPAVGYMVKVKYLRELTNMEIYNTYYSGQNRQVFLPLYYCYKCYSIDRPLVNYLVRESSISHGDYAKYDVLFKLYNLFEAYIDAIFDTIKPMTSEDRIYYRQAFLAKESLDMALYAKSLNRTDDAKKMIDNYYKYGGSKGKLLKFRLLSIVNRVRRKIFGR